MPWCRLCRNNNAVSGRGKSAPSRKDGGDMNDDERAVSWWRNRQQSRDEDDGPRNSASVKNANRSSNLEQSKSRLEPRIPLHRPYELQHGEPPLVNTLKNGGVKPASKQHKKSTPPQSPAVAATSSTMQIFRPEVSVPGAKMAPTPLSGDGRTNVGEVGRGHPGGIVGQESPSERITAIEPAASQEYLDDDGDAAKHKKAPARRDPSAKYAHKASLNLADYEETHNRRIPDPMPPLRPGRSRASQQNVQNENEQMILQQQPRKYDFLQKGRSSSKGRKSAKQDGRGEKNDEDHLSDVPSDVDSVTKERYILACQMLKSTLMMKEKTMEPLEREFILSLLGDYESVVDEGSVITESQLSAVEQAKLRLETDPIFQVEGAAEKRQSRGPPPSPMTAATKQSRENAERPGVSPTTQQTNATRSKPKVNRPFLTNPCNRRSADDIDSPADIVLYVREDEDDDNHFNGDDSASGNDGNLQQEGSDSGANQIVRFDGWSDHKSAEYPFRILGADDPRLKPRVLTPAIMEALQGFFPYVVSESNFWLKFSLMRDGASLKTLLSSIRASTHTIIGVETNDGEVFGSFTATPWRTGTRWFGNGEAFLWRLKKSRFTSAKNAKRSNFENEMEVYPYTGYDDLVQYCTSKTIAVGGGDWLNNPSPFPDEPRGIGFMIDGDLAGGETNSCATFANPRLCRKTSASNEFKISNLEVWTLTPCINVKDAAKMEVQKLFIEENYA